MTEFELRIDGLTEISLLGSGRFAKVYKARQELLGRWVKVMDMR